MNQRRDPDAHCRRHACPCTHTGECHRGWLDWTQDGHEHTIPCPTCRPQTYRLINMASDRATMQKELQNPNRVRRNPYGD